LLVAGFQFQFCQAQFAGLTELKLETGNQQAEALALFKAFGFRRCGPFGGYPQGVTSLFFVKPVR
jgi:putative acetyltransferase